MKIIVAIPARIGSTRLPAKALADICGEPMVVRVWRRCAQVRGVADVLVATDDERICVASVAAAGGSGEAKVAMSASSGAGLTKGSSPCTLTTRSQSSPRTAAAIRSVPETWCVAVRTALPPAARTAAPMRSSSVATRTAATPRTREHRRQTRTTIGSPQISASALPGRRVDPIRAGMAMTIFTAAG